jgi:hypothetical protein
MMTHKSRTTNDVLEEKRRRQEGDPAPVGQERERLQVLVGELLSENQKLRFRVSQLEQQAQGAELGLKDATKWAGMVF